MKRTLLIFFTTILLTSHACAGWINKSWVTPNNQMVYWVGTQSIGKPSVFLGVACIAGFPNATVSVMTDFPVGNPSTSQLAIYQASRDGAFKKGDPLQQTNATVTEDGLGLYLLTGQLAQSFAMSVLRNYGWIAVHWDFRAPQRSNLVNSVLGQPSAIAAQQHNFDVRGFSSATTLMAQQCQW